VSLFLSFSVPTACLEAHRHIPQQMFSPCLRPILRHYLAISDYAWLDGAQGQTSQMLDSMLGWDVGEEDQSVIGHATQELSRRSCTHVDVGHTISLTTPVVCISCSDQSTVCCQLVSQDSKNDPRRGRSVEGQQDICCQQIVTSRVQAEINR
jgi:hypothetical protein